MRTIITVLIAAAVAIAVAIALSVPTPALADIPSGSYPVNFEIKTPTAPEVWPVCTTFKGVLDLQRIDLGESDPEHPEYDNGTPGQDMASPTNEFCMQNFDNDTKVHVSRLYRGWTDGGMMPVRAEGKVNGKRFVGWIILTKEIINKATEPK